MSWVNVLRASAALTFGAGLLIPTAVVQAAPNAGTVPASTKVRAQIVKDVEVFEPARCYAPVLAKSDRNWGLLSPNLGPSGCNIGYYAIPVLYKAKGKWNRIGIPPEPKCTWLKGVLVDSYNAPVSVIRDFQAVGYCT